MGNKCCKAGNTGTYTLVYFWGKDKDSYGHVSLQLSGGTHISFWPSKPVKGTKIPKGIVAALCATFEWIDPIQDMTLDKDIEFEGRKPDEIIRLPEDDELNEIQIKQWWIGFKDQNKYNALRLNCSTVVWKALCAGGALHYIHDPNYWWFDPESVRMLAYAILRGIKTKREQNVKLPPIPNSVSSDLARADALGSINEVTVASMVKKMKKF